MQRSYRTGGGGGGGGGNASSREGRASGSGGGVGSSSSVNHVRLAFVGGVAVGASVASLVLLQHHVSRSPAAITNDSRWAKDKGVSISRHYTIIRNETASSRTATAPIFDTIYGHIHMAKTGGTTLNGMMANEFERVCGHKGYSYDYFQANKRFTQRPKDTLWEYVEDGISAAQKGYNRGRVPMEIMDEIGYEDCDWISFELDWPIWRKFQAWPQKLEIHVPCREPIDHLMSQCHFRMTKLNCTESTADLKRKLDRCMVFIDRFSMKLISEKNIAGVKCFDFRHSFDEYIDFMVQRLDRKRIKATDLTFRETNSARNKTNECIWDDSSTRELALSYLMEKYDYYKFCNKCIGSNDDLLAVD